MIIPPDPEKDPNVFSPTSSTPSLIPPPSESDFTDSLDLDIDVAHPEPAHTRNPTFGYPFGDDLGVGYNGEALPPYQRRGDGRDADADSHANINIFDDPITASSSASTAMRERTRRHMNTPGIIIPSTADDRLGYTPRSPDQGEDELTPVASSSTMQLPYTSLDTPSSTLVSTAKLWEGSSQSDVTRGKGKGKGRRGIGLLPPSTLGESWRRWWKRWRKWVYIFAGLLLAGLGVMIGLLVGFKAGVKKDNASVNNGPPWKDTSDDGKRQNWVSHGESLNITYVASRDGPCPDDGVLTNCPNFTPFNSSSPITLLSRPFPGQTASVARFEFPLNKNGSTPATLPDFTFIARGLGSSGTVEIVGNEAPSEVTASGKEGVVSIEVVALYAGQQQLSDLVKVCELQRNDGGLGLGIFTPQETDGKVSNAYMVNPLLLPSFHLVIRLPPSAFNNASPSVIIPELAFHLDRMAVRFGNLHNVANFGHINVTSLRGGVVSGYVAAERVDISSSENPVRGLYNVSKSLIIDNTEGSILAQVILYDPGTLNSTTPGDTSTQDGSAAASSTAWKRGSYRSATPSAPAAPTSSASATASLDANAAASSTTPSVQPTHSVYTRFTTGEGLVSVSYIGHPPLVALSAFLATGQGDMSVNLHPNYVGPFVVKDTWGQVRIPQPQPLWDQDPRDWGRKRMVSYGPINIDAGGVFDTQGLNQTVLDNSPMAISGAAYWRGDEGDQKPVKVQTLQESGGEVLIMGSWGDVRLSVDGT